MADLVALFVCVAAVLAVAVADVMWLLLFLGLLLPLLDLKYEAEMLSGLAWVWAWSWLSRGQRLGTGRTQKMQGCMRFGLDLQHSTEISRSMAAATVGAPVQPFQPGCLIEKVCRPRPPFCICQ